jgi:hypothetical protein
MELSLIHTVHSPHPSSSLLHPQNHVVADQACVMKGGAGLTGSGASEWAAVPCQWAWQTLLMGPEGSVIGFCLFLIYFLRWALDHL